MAIRSLGTTLEKYGIDGFVIDGLTSIGEIGIESDEIDVTTLDSVGGYKEFVAGLKDGGEVVLSGFIKNEEHIQAMINLAVNQNIERWGITAPNAAIWFFDAFVKSFKETEATVDGVRGFSATLRITGKPHYSALGLQ